MCDVFLTASFSVRSCWFLPLLHPRLGSISLVSFLLFLRTIFAQCPFSPQWKPMSWSSFHTLSPFLLEIRLFCFCDVPLNTFSEALCRSVSVFFTFLVRSEERSCGCGMFLAGKGCCGAVAPAYFWWSLLSSRRGSIASRTPWNCDVILVRIYCITVKLLNIFHNKYFQKLCKYTFSQT